MNLRGIIQFQQEEPTRAEVVIGIPSFNDAASIEGVVSSAREAIGRFFADREVVLVLSDAGSDDRTAKRAQAAAGNLPFVSILHRVDPHEKISMPYHGLPGRGNGVQCILNYAAALNARAIVFVGADLTNPTPEAIRDLAEPILRWEFDFVAPFYHRHALDGTISKLILYPVIRALYGRRLPQLVGREFALSGQLAEALVKEPIWDSDIARYTVDLWMAATAMVLTARIAQVDLGPRQARTAAVSVELPTMLEQILGGLVQIIGRHFEFWRSIRGTEAVPVLGKRHGARPPDIKINADRMMRAFELGLGEFLPVWREALSPGTIGNLEALRGAVPRRFPNELWADIVFGFASAGHRRVMAAQHLFRSFAPLYLGRVASFVHETQPPTGENTEEILEGICAAFEKSKADLIENWNRPTTRGGTP